MEHVAKTKPTDTAAAPPRARARSRISSNLRLIRNMAGVTLNELAVEAGVSTWRISLVERNLSAAKPGEVEAITAALDRLAKAHETDGGAA